MQTHGRPSLLPYNLSAPTRPRRSGYEPSDTETDFQESPRREFNPNNTKLADQTDPLRRFQTSPLRANRRFHSSRFEHSTESQSSHRRRHNSKSPYKRKRLDYDVGVIASQPQPRVFEVGRAKKKANYASKRSTTAPRLRVRESEKSERTQSPPPLPLKSAEINERVALSKLAGDTKVTIFESTDSISPGDIFFSREWTILAMPKKP